MTESETVLEQAPEVQNTQISCEDVLKQYEANSEALCDLKERIQYLQDLFLRRLKEDKQKSEMIRHLEELSSFAVLEPMLSDLLLLLDRVSGADDLISQSVAEELFDILQRRGLTRIDTDVPFNPSVHKAVRLVLDNSVSSLQIHSVIRQGYLFNGRVLRPAEVIVVKPDPNSIKGEA